MGQIRYPYLRYDQIVEAGERFLEERHSSRNIPIPIERIVEGMGIDIVPFPGLHRAYDTDGFTTSDLSAIYVEEYVYLNIETRYRFTLAHEVGHVWLHGDFYRTLAWKSPSDWKRIIQEIPDREYGFMEWHANAFAGIVLVPDRRIEEQVSRCEEIIDHHYPGARSQPEAYQEFLAECLGNEFQVSPEVAMRRLKKWIERKF